jgi:hypothetical protein
MRKRKKGIIFSKWIYCPAKKPNTKDIIAAIGIGIHRIPVFAPFSDRGEISLLMKMTINKISKRIVVNR